MSHVELVEEVVAEEVAPEREVAPRDPHLADRAIVEERQVLATKAHHTRQAHHHLPTRYQEVPQFAALPQVPVVVDR